MPDVADLEEWMRSYWRHPDPEAVPEVIDRLHRAGVLGGSAGPAVAAFLAQVARRDPARVAAWPLDDAQLDPGERLTLAQALWLADDEAARGHLDRLLDGADAEVAEVIEGFRVDDPPAIVALPLTAPVVLDMLWGAFGATGDPRCLARVAEGLTGADAEDDPTRELVASAARWSLGSRVAEDAEVRRLVEGLVPDAAPETAAALRALLAEHTDRG
ncbi:MAG: hypothetical protein KY434_05260 [Actinobacteria bacterium]|nr:hypothetical protein [Actinomycetota bacterium]